MIQIYSAENKDYDHNGDMTLLPEECSVHVVLNGEWTATLEHPIDDEGRWKYINDNAVVKMPSFNGEQLFRIKNKEKRDSGVSAELTPIFLDAKEDCFLLDVRPTEKNGQDALDIMTAPNKMYSAKSDIKKLSTAYYQTKNLIEAINGNDENSFINRWGGEILYNNYQITIDDHVGGDYGVQVLYGKNIVKDGFSETIDMTEVATRIIPKSYNGYMIAGDAPWIDSPLIEKYPTVHYKVMSFEDVKMRADASEDDETNGTIICDTQEQIEGALKKKCEEQYAAGVDKPKITIKADMELLQNTELYEDVKELEVVSLGDTVHCKHSKLGIVSDARVIELEWDAVRNKLTSATLGEFQYNFLNNVSSIMNRVEQAIRSDGSVDVGAMQMSFWWNWDASNPEYDLVTISDTPNEKYKLKPWTECKSADRTITPWCIGSAYVSGIASDGLLRSQPGLKPERNQSHNNMITNYQKKGKGHLGAGSERNTFQILFNIIKGATKNSQSLFQGCTGYSFQYSASIESADAHTYFPVTNAQAQNILVGSYVSVGYGKLKTDTNTVNNDRGVANIHKYADDVKVLRIETLDENNKAVYLDVKTGFNTTPIKLSDTVNAPITITSMHWWSGSTDAVIGRHDGSFGSNTDGKYPYC